MARNNGQNVSTLFNSPEDIRKAIYTTNAIESLSSVFRKAIKKRKLFQHDDSAKKVIFLAIDQAPKKWTMQIINWKTALNQFMIEFEDRLKDVIGPVTKLVQRAIINSHMSFKKLN